MQFDIVSSTLRKPAPKVDECWAVIQRRTGLFTQTLSPTIMAADLSTTSSLVPLPIIRYHDVAEVAAKANDSPMGAGRFGAAILIKPKRSPAN
jgi:hypothetical protein